MTAGQIADLLHGSFDDTGNCHVMLVGGFSVLEINVGVLGCTGLVGMLRVKRTAAEGFDGFPVYQLGNIFVIDFLNLLHFVAGTETIKEVDKRNR